MIIVCPQRKKGSSTIYVLADFPFPLRRDTEDGPLQMNSGEAKRGLFFFFFAYAKIFISEHYISGKTHMPALISQCTLAEKVYEFGFSKGSVSSPLRTKQGLN